MEQNVEEIIPHELNAIYEESERGEPREDKFKVRGLYLKYFASRRRHRIHLFH